MSILITDGNAFAIMGEGRRELIRLGRENEIDAFMDKMTSGDYVELLQTFTKWFPDAEIEL
jgi:hypothetical protein